MDSSSFAGGAFRRIGEDGECEDSLENAVDAAR
jgi:hypothetical protein